MTSQWIQQTFMLLCIATLMACGGGSGSDDTTLSGQEENGLSTLAISTQTVAPGPQCAEGGVEIDTGVDTNQNGILDTSEVTDTYNLCHGQDGDNGLVAIINTEELSAGLECALGGIKITSGMDINGNAQLDTTEISSSSTLCNFNNGAVNGFNSLVDLTDEAEGANCAYGGQRIATGSDTNRNAELDAEEILEIKYLCQAANGADGDAALVSLVDEPQGNHCANGGVRVDAGLDTSGDGTLQSEEITSQNYICKGSDGEAALNSLVDVATVPAGNICTQGGQKISSGLDANANDALDMDEITRTAYVCNGNGAGDSSPDLVRDSYISYEQYLRPDSEAYPLCTQINDEYYYGEYGNSTLETTYFDLETGTFSEPYATCTITNCSGNEGNLAYKMTAKSGSNGCPISYTVNYSCDLDYGNLVLNEDKTACVDLPSEPPVEQVCSYNAIQVCDTESSCSDAGGHWWNNQCNYYCAPGDITVDGQCETPINEADCDDLQIISNNQCTDLTFTEITGDLCGTYSEPSIIKSGTRSMTCNTEFTDVVVIEAGTTVNVDNFWSFKAKDIRVNGTAAEPVIFKPSDTNPHDKWTDFSILENYSYYERWSNAFDVIEGYESGNRIQYLTLENVNKTQFEGVTLENVDISTEDLHLDAVYIKLSTINTYKTGSIRYMSMLDTEFNSQTNYGSFYNSILINNAFDLTNEPGFSLYNSLIASSNLFRATLRDYSYNNSTTNFASNSSLLLNSLNQSSCYETSFPYYEKIYLSGNHYTNGSLPESTEYCIAEGNSLTEISNKNAVYILGPEVFDIATGETINPRVIVMDKNGLIKDATVEWKARYDNDGIVYNLPESWEGYQPAISFDQKESYELYIHSINGDTDILGHRVLRVHVEQ